MFAADTTRAGRRAVLGMAALLITGCATGAPPVDPSLIQKAAPNSDRPPFFIQWKSGDMPGLTARPQMDKSSRPPPYPDEALRSGKTGITVLNVCVTIDGKLSDVHVLKSAGFDALDQATVEWAKTAKYTPAMFNNEPFAVCGYQLQYEWRLEKQGG